MEAGTTKGGAVEAGPDPFDVGQVGDQAKRQHTDIASPCMNDEPAAWSVPEDGGGSDMTTESAAMCARRRLFRERQAAATGRP